jgi:hypothetical protein
MGGVWKATKGKTPPELRQRQNKGPQPNGERPGRAMLVIGCPDARFGQSCQGQKLGFIPPRVISIVVAAAGGCCTFDSDCTPTVTATDTAVAATRSTDSTLMTAGMV